MAARKLSTAIRTFSESAYEILDESLAETGNVVIWSMDPMTPELGDRFLIESGGEIHDLSVYALTTFRGGWSIVCRADGL